MSPPRGWLAQVLAEAFAQSRAASQREAPGTRLRATRRVVAAMYERGLAFGVPALRQEQLLAKAVAELAPVVRWIAVMCDLIDVFGRIVGENAASVEEQHARRTRAFTAALALVYTNERDGVLLARGAGDLRQQKALGAIERELERRRYLHGNPLLGLSLSHAFIAIDSRAILDAAMTIYARDAVSRGAESIQATLRAERLATLSAIAHLSEQREVIDADLVRSASIWQVKALGLSRHETGRLLEQVKNPADLNRIVLLTPLEARQRVFMRIAMVAILDGRLSPEEREIVASMARAFGVSRALATRMERRVHAYVTTHRTLMNPMVHAAGFAAANPPIAVRMARALFENVDHAWNEIRETGDLAVLLGRRARGQTLTDDENRRMREQLMDVVKAVPSLAIFTLPGGMVLLPLLLKVLPFDFRPSSFRGNDFRAFARSDDDALAERMLVRAGDDAGGS